MSYEVAVSEAAAGAFQSAVRVLAQTRPDGLVEHGPGGALLAFTRSQIPALNGVVSVAPTPDTTEIGLLCEKAEGQAGGLPWSIRLRGEPDAELIALAASHGLGTITRQPFMLRRLTSGPATTESGRTAEQSVRLLREGEYETFATVLGAAFGAPPAIITSLYTPAVLGRPFVRAYLGETDGVPVGAGLAIHTDQHVGLANIGTLPEHRRRGLGRVIIDTILADARDAGAHTAYLHSSDDAVPLFERAGFRTEESWTAFTA
ncbi:GNAT family N-acetyltransferase [Streptomyces sp. E5N91]|uniref:GNAT family N-acetyltransferase n=1 Tax=Streptomyces sp. E5N91 TaxID=1851996 RepID=UPI000EF62CC0|nr:GNAT family N-acetyltransferase [Streptomyces sp. E5N91]